MRLTGVRVLDRVIVRGVVAAAIAGFVGALCGMRRAIVVITDGVNYQFNSPNPKRRDDVMTAMGDHKIPVDIVGFGIPAAEQAEAAKEFGALAEQTQGSFTPVSSGTTLVKSLETYA